MIADSPNELCTLEQIITLRYVPKPLRQSDGSTVLAPAEHWVGETLVCGAEGEFNRHSHLVFLYCRDDTIRLGYALNPDFGTCAECESRTAEEAGYEDLGAYAVSPSFIVEGDGSELNVNSCDPLDIETDEFASFSSFYVWYITE